MVKYHFNVLYCQVWTTLEPFEHTNWIVPNQISFQRGALLSYTSCYEWGVVEGRNILHISFKFHIFHRSLRILAVSTKEEAKKGLQRFLEGRLKTMLHSPRTATLWIGTRAGGRGCGRVGQGRVALATGRVYMFGLHSAGAYVSECAWVCVCEAYKIKSMANVAIVARSPNRCPHALSVTLALSLSRSFSLCLGRFLSLSFTRAQLSVAFVSLS